MLRGCSAAIDGSGSGCTVRHVHAVEPGKIRQTVDWWDAYGQRRIDQCWLKIRWFGSWGGMGDETCC